MSESWDWPEGARCAVVLAVDVDAESGILGDGPECARRPTTRSAERHPGVVPAILEDVASHAASVLAARVA